jgi:hypothetical protein
MIFIEKPRHVSMDEAEAWLEREVEPLGGNGVHRVRLRRLRDPSLRFAQSWAFMVEVDCRDAAVARDVVSNGPGLELLADLRLLGVWPSLALIDDSD